MKDAERKGGNRRENKAGIQSIPHEEGNADQIRISLKLKIEKRVIRILGQIVDPCPKKEVDRSKQQQLYLRRI